MSNDVTKKQIVLFSAIFISMLGSLVFGLFLVKGEQVENCWNQYSTEEQAILNCEGQQ